MLLTRGGASCVPSKAGLIGQDDKLGLALLL